MVENKKLLIFDLGDVLILGAYSLERIAMKYGLPVMAIKRDYHQFDKPLMDGSMSVEEYYKHFESRFNVKLEGDAFRDTFCPYYRNEIMFAIAAGARKRGVRTAVGSNTFAPHWDGFKTEIGLERDIDALYASHLIGYAKPDVRFWQYIMEKEGFTPEETLFIDDREENVEAARSIGIDAFLYEDNNSLSEKFRFFLEA